MSADQRIGRKDQTIDDENPCEEQMPLSSHRKPLSARDCRPTGKSAAGSVRVAEHTGRIKGMSKNCRDPSYAAVFRLNWSNRQKWTVAIGTIPPIECRMGIEDL